MMKKQKAPRKFRGIMVRLFCALFGFQAFLIVILALWFVMLGVLAALTIDMLLHGEHLKSLIPVA